jgi:hypothetical protein
MACPYFYPTERFGEAVWPHPARLPLGDGFAGRCCAQPGNEFTPMEAAVLECCNLGYARGSCARFPPGDGPDAVLFTVCGEQDGIVTIYYVTERDHRPHEHGALAYDTQRGDFAAPPDGRLLRRQAEAYVEGYLRRKLRF